MLRGVIAHDGGVGNVAAATPLETPFDRGPPTASLENRVEGPEGPRGGAVMFGILPRAHELVQVARGNVDEVTRRPWQRQASPSLCGSIGRQDLSLNRRTGF